jgi:hypothetical protein
MCSGVGVESTLVGIVQHKSRGIRKIICQWAVQLRILKVKTSPKIIEAYQATMWGIL